MQWSLKCVVVGEVLAIHKPTSNILSRGEESSLAHLDQSWHYLKPKGNKRRTHNRSRFPQVNPSEQKAVNINATNLALINSLETALLLQTIYCKAPLPVEWKSTATKKPCTEQLQPGRILLITLTDRKLVYRSRKTTVRSSSNLSWRPKRFFQVYSGWISSLEETHMPWASGKNLQFWKPYI